jgi:predicted Zn-dependent protease
VRRIALIAIGLATSACGTKGPALGAKTIADYRGEGTSEHAILAELIVPGGNLTRAERSLAASRPQTFEGHIAAALIHEERGRSLQAASAYAEAIRLAAKTPVDLNASWFAANRFSKLASFIPEAYAAIANEVDQWTTMPSLVGWRTLSELHEAWSMWRVARGEHTLVENEVASRAGCASSARFAGPFGKGKTSDLVAQWPAETEGPWPAAWASNDALVQGGVAARVVPARRSLCNLHPSTNVRAGVYFVDTFFETDDTASLLVAVRGATAIYIDDRLVLTRSPLVWGSWLRFGVNVSVARGRHRLVAKLSLPTTSVRILQSDGRAAKVRPATSTGPYSLVAPTVLPGDNAAYEALQREAQLDPIARFFAAQTAMLEEHSDIATRFIEPLVAPKDATPFALLAAEQFVTSDATLPKAQREAAAEAYGARAATRDDGLLRIRLGTIRKDLRQRRLDELVVELERLVHDFPERPEPYETLAKVYGGLGWRAERSGALRRLAKRFPYYAAGLEAAIAGLEEDGFLQEADRLSEILSRIVPTPAVRLNRAIATHNWTAARVEAEALWRQSPTSEAELRKVIEVLHRAGDVSRAEELIGELKKRFPRDAAAKLSVADLLIAKHNINALDDALRDATREALPTQELERASWALRQSALLESYRTEGKRAIADFETWRKRGNDLAGTTARVLDYSAIWVKSDGSSDLLEHQVQRIQSQEAITRESEMAPPEGLLLRLRVIKPDGRELEPEGVAGKPTITWPHLEVGDFIEVEHVIHQGPSADGSYRSPHWFFREQDKGYFRSELVLITPKGKSLSTEVRGPVPPASVQQLGEMVVRRWRMDLSPPVQLEPASPSPLEFLPSVRSGWGTTLDKVLDNYREAAFDPSPLDPRITKLAQSIVGDVRGNDDRARLVYRWVQDTLENGQERDPRRVILGRTGSRVIAMLHLLRHLGIGATPVIVRSKFATAPQGPMSQVDSLDGLLIRIALEDRKSRWLSVSDKYHPYGYISPELRGQAGYTLDGKAQEVDVPDDTTSDAITYDGRAILDTEGGATAELSMTVSGARASAFRQFLLPASEAKRIDLFEREVMSSTLGNCRASGYTLANLRSYDSPLTVRLTAKCTDMFTKTGSGVLLRALFPVDVAQLAALPERESPYLRRQTFMGNFHYEVVVPHSFKLPASLPTATMGQGLFKVDVRDRVEGHAIVIDRAVEMPIVRIAPGQEYASFRAFAQEAHDALNRQILLGSGVK